jgi:hypothetical protein
MKTKYKREEVMLEVIKELVEEKNKWEFRAKHPLPKGWSYGEEHPRFGELVTILKQKDNGTED